MNREQSEFLLNDARHGWEIVDSAARLGVMDRYLHGIGGDQPNIKVDDRRRGAWYLPSPSVVVPHLDPDVGAGDFHAADLDAVVHKRDLVVRVAVLCRRHREDAPAPFSRPRPCPR